MLIDFIAVSLIALLIIAITTMIAYEILRNIWAFAPKMKIAPRLRVMVVIIPIFITHIICIWLYALTYFLIENYTDLGTLTGNIAQVSVSYESFIERLYFSASTYASLGIGDIAPSRHLRMIAAAEVLNGLVLIGWTVSLTYLAMEKFWGLPHNRRDKK